MSQTYQSGTNNTTGREPFEDSTRSTGLGSGQHHTTGLGSNTNAGHSGLTSHLVPGTSGDFKAGTSADPAVSAGRHTGEGLLAGGASQQTGDQYGGIQTGSTTTGTGHNVPVEGHKPIGEKIKEAVGLGHKHDDTTTTTHRHGDNNTGLGSSSGTGLGSGTHHTTGTGSGLTGSGTHHTTGTGLTSGTGTGAGLTGGLGSGEHHHHDHQHGTHTDVTGTLGSGLSTATKSTPTGTTHFEHQPVDHTTGQVHQFTTTTTTGGTGTGIGSGVGVGSGLTSGTHHHQHGEGAHYGSNTSANDYDNRTSGLTGSHSHGTGLTGSHGTGTGLTGSHGTGTGLTGSHGTGTGLTGSHGTGTDHSAGYDRSSVGNTGVTGLQGREGSGVLSSGAAGTDRFDSDRTHTGADYGHQVGDKHSNDHKLSGVTRHGDDFTGGDTADSAYKNYGKTGLTGREGTTTGVHDSNLESTAPEKEGIFTKIKNAIGGHSNTSHADDTTAGTTKHT